MEYKHIFFFTFFHCFFAFFEKSLLSYEKYQYWVEKSDE
jgi:hypothetical protein